MAMTHMETFAGWRKSRHSNDTGNCVEVGSSLSHAGVRDTKDPAASVLAVTPGAWKNFLHTVKTGTAGARAPW